MRIEALVITLCIAGCSSDRTEKCHIGDALAPDSLTVHGHTQRQDRDDEELFSDVRSNTLGASLKWEIPQPSDCYPREDPEPPLE